jgi:hypothetical protein
MTNDELRQFAMLQLETVLGGYEWSVENSTDRLWAALYSVQRMNGGPMPDDFGVVMNKAVELDREKA